MYEVAIKASPDDFLDWDKPLSQQSEKVRTVLTSMPEFVNRLDANDPLINGQHILAAFTNQADATTRLKSAGIKGIRYKDAGSRGAAANASRKAIVQPHPLGGFQVVSSEGRGDVLFGLRDTIEDAEALAKSINAPTQTSNYVVFDDQIIDIMKKYGIALPAAAALKAYQDQMRPEPSHQKRR